MSLVRGLIAIDATTARDGLVFFMKGQCDRHIGDQCMHLAVDFQVGQGPAHIVERSSRRWCSNQKDHHHGDHQTESGKTATDEYVRVSHEKQSLQMCVICLAYLPMRRAYGSNGYK